jgi:hypothetical protein
MADIERLTITLPSEMAAIGKGAVEGGGDASSSEVARDFDATGIIERGKKLLAVR